MAFVAGQFEGIENADLPGANRYPFLNTQPVGDYVLSVLELRGFLRQDGRAAFAADFEVVSGPDGCAARVAFMATRGGHYYEKDIKALANALTGGEAPEAINGAMMEMMCGDDQPAAGSRCSSVVYVKDQKTQAGVLTGDTIRVNTFDPPPKTAA
jgi:hypothetical protein